MVSHLSSPPRTGPLRTASDGWSETLSSYPPGPKGIPFLGNAPEFRRDPLTFLSGLARDYGDVAHFRLFRKHVVQVSHPDLIRDVLVTNHQSFQKTGFLERARPILGNGLVTSEGDLHSRQRKLIQPAMSRMQVSSYAELIASTADKFTKSWSAGTTVDIFQEMLHLTLDVVANTLFGVELDSNAAEIEDALTTVIEYFDSLLSPLGQLQALLPFRSNLRFRAALRSLDNVVYKMIAKRRASAGTGCDILSLLLASRTEDGNGMTDQQVRDEVMTFFTAGHETVATALTWTWYLLAQHPTVFEQIRNEVCAVVTGPLPAASDIDNLKFTEAVFAESMRLFPPVWAITRRALTSVSIADFTLPPGTIVGMSQYVTHRDARFFPNPEDFKPSRWLADEKAKRAKFAYFPFGGGPRICIGEAFAWMEGTIILATIARNWQPLLPPEARIGFMPTITLRPKHGMMLQLRQLKHPSAENAEKSTFA